MQVVAITPEYQGKVKACVVCVKCWPPTGAKDNSSDEAKAGESRCLRASLSPFGPSLPHELVSQTEGCALTSILATLALAPNTNLTSEFIVDIADNAVDLFSHLYPKEAGILASSFGPIHRVFQDREFKAALEEWFNLGHLHMKKVLVPNDASPSADSRLAPPKKRPATIEELLAKGAGTAFVLQVVEPDGDSTHCIALINNNDDTSTFADCSRDCFYKATAESFKHLGFASICEAREVKWMPVRDDDAGDEADEKEYEADEDSDYDPNGNGSDTNDSDYDTDVEDLTNCDAEAKADAEVKSLNPHFLHHLHHLGRLEKDSEKKRWTSFLLASDLLCKWCKWCRRRGMRP